MRPWYLVSAVLILLSCSKKETAKDPDKKAAAQTANTKGDFSEGAYSEDVADLVTLAQTPAVSVLDWEGPPDREGEGGQAVALRALFGPEQRRLWAAFTLARHCSVKHPDRSVAGLTNATALWLTESNAPSDQLLETAGWAIGTCARPESEEILRRWLMPEAQADHHALLVAAAMGLAAYVDRRGGLSERTQTAVLDAASREKDATLLLPLARMGRLSEAVGAHLLEVSAQLLTTEQKAGRRSAIFALGSAGPSAAAPLAQILSSSNFSTQELAAAAQALGRLGNAGQEGLDRALATLLSQGLPLLATNPRWIAILEAIKTLEAPDKSRAELRKLTSVVLPTSEDLKKRAERHRLIELRCRAADLLAQDASLSSALLECDPDQGRTFALAQLRVLDRGLLNGKRLEIYNEHLKSKDPLVAQAALRLLVSHPELLDQHQILLQALSSENPGTVTTALQLISAYPSRLGTDGKTGESPRDQIILRLQELLDEDAARKLPEETLAAALMSAGALGALNLKPRVLAVCNGKNRILWSRAEQALGLLGSTNISCPTRAPQASELVEASRVQLPIELVIESDIGQLKLTLDNPFAPQAVDHVLSLVESGAFNDSKIGASKLGFALQFGDRNEDGYDDQVAPGLSFEVSPAPFSGSVLGLSSFAPGAENNQLFVTVSDAPQLTGTRVILGHAEGPWELLIPGDVLQSVKRLPK